MAGVAMDEIDGGAVLDLAYTFVVDSLVGGDTTAARARALVDEKLNDAIVIQMGIDYREHPEWRDQWGTGTYEAQQNAAAVAIVGGPAGG